MSKQTYSNQKSQIVSFYANKNVLITGGTGFLGKLLIQKLISACSDISGIYLIIRKKKGLSCEQRLEKMFDNPVFDIMKKDFPDFRKKLYLIYGEMQFENLALSHNDRLLICEKINIVIHGAASVNFGTNLKDATYTNVRSTRDLLKLCEQIKHLECIGYISTAYSNCIHKVIDEYFYETPIEPETLIDFVTEIDTDILNEMTPKLLGKWPNTYTYTKAVTERLIQKNLNRLPIGILRPSMVISTYKDPVPNWTDNIYGPLGMMVAASLGLLHVTIASESILIDTIPADLVINNILCAIPDIKKQNHDLQVCDRQIIYNIAVTPDVSLTVPELQRISGKYYINKPSISFYAMFYYIVQSYPLYIILSIIFHFIPAILVDAALILCRRKPMLIKIYKKMHTLIVSLSYFSINEFQIRNNNTRRLWTELNDTDKTIFNFDVLSIVWDEYFRQYADGVKKYVLKQSMDPEHLKRANQKYQRLQNIHLFLKTILRIALAYLLWRIIHNYLFL